MIAEAEKAAEALEIAAQKSPLAHASLIETRKLISEAIQSIESIEKEVAFTDGNLSPPSTELISHTAAEIGALDDAGERINGWHAVMPLESGINDLENGQHALQGLLNGKSSALLSSSGEYDSLGDRDEVYQLISSVISPEKGANITQPSTSTQKLDGDEANESPGDEKKPLPNGLISESKIEEAPSQPPTTTTKKWVRGKLVEVGEGS